MTAKTGPQIRSERVRGHVCQVLDEIASEIEKAGGLYGAGRLNKAELVRRTGKSRSVIDRMPEVEEFLERYRVSDPKGRTRGSASESDRGSEIAVLQRIVGVLEADIRVLRALIERRDREIADLKAVVLKLGAPGLSSLD